MKHLDTIILISAGAVVAAAISLAFNALWLLVIRLSADYFPTIFKLF